MTDEQQYIYRYRSIKKLFDFKELEDLEIYFSKPEELNDQMEDYMNIIWQGDEIAFQGLFKHYLYTLYHLYALASLIEQPNENLDKDKLPIFIQYKDLSLPQMKTTFKSIYDEFFNSDEISKLVKQMAKSQKKYTTDEILAIFKTIHIYAYFVVNTIIKKNIYRIDLLSKKEYKETYNEIKHWDGYSKLINLINVGNNKESIAKQINNIELQQNINKSYINQLYSNKNNYNINILSFDFPELYTKQVKKLLYNNYCVACFSETYQNEPMWSHYADSENGVCLRYKIKQDNENEYINLYSITGISSDRNGTTINRGYSMHKLNKIAYSNEYPEIDFFKSLGCIPSPVITGFWLCNYEQTQFSSCLEAYKDMDKWRENYHELANQYICTKSKNWEYEKEYRVFLREMLHPTYEEKENRLVKYNFNDLDAIIFGRQVEIEDKKKIIKIIQNHCKQKNLSGFKFYDLYYSTITKQLEIKPCNEYLFSGQLLQNTHI